MTIHAVVLAAGKGTRMKSDLAKVLHSAAGRTLIDWTLDALRSVADVTVVVGHQAEDVAAKLPGEVRIAVQQPQNGTGHAVEVGLAGLDPMPELVRIPHRPVAGPCRQGRQRGANTLVCRVDNRVDAWLVRNPGFPAPILNPPPLSTRRKAARR